MTSVPVRQAVQANTSNVATGVHFVPLLQLPNDLRFPEPLHDRIWFDDQRKCLAFRGFMSKASYDRLDGLTNDDAYQRALDELFRQSVYEASVPQRRPLREVLPIAALLMAVALTVLLAIPLRLYVLR